MTVQDSKPVCFCIETLSSLSLKPVILLSLQVKRTDRKQPRISISIKRTLN